MLVFCMFLVKLKKSYGHDETKLNVPNQANFKSVLLYTYEKHSRRSLKNCNTDGTLTHIMTILDEDHVNNSWIFIIKIGIKILHS